MAVAVHDLLEMLTDRNHSSIKAVERVKAALDTIETDGAAAQAAADAAQTTADAATVAAAAAGLGAVRAIVMVVGTGATTDSTTQIPAGAFVLGARTVILTQFSVGATLMLGTAADTDKFLATTDQNLVAAAGTLVDKPRIENVAAAAAVRATIGGAPAVGSVLVCVQYSLPNN